MTTRPGSPESQMAIRRALRHGARSVRPHLDAIDPAAVGAAAADRWVRAAGPLAGPKARATIAEHVVLLATYAKTGEGGLRAAFAMFEAIVGWLFSRAADPPPDPMSVLLDAPDAADGDRLALAVVLIAARGRIRLAMENVIAVAEIAALTGLDQSHLARLTREGVLERSGPVVSKQHPPPIKGDSAREMLRVNGVKGI